MGLRVPIIYCVVSMTFVLALKSKVYPFFVLAMMGFSGGYLGGLCGFSQFSREDQI